MGFWNENRFSSRLECVPEIKFMEPQFRSFNDIMIDADNATTVDDLIKYSNELFDNKKQYPLIQLQFAVEYFQELNLRFKNTQI